MAYNSSGVFSRVHDFTDDRDNGIRIQASRMDAEMDGIATGLSTAITKDGTQTTTAIIPFAVGLSIIDNQSAIFGTTSDYTLQYDEATRDSLMLTSNVEGAAFKLTLAADQGDDASDEWQVGISTSGVLTIGNDIASAQTYVSQLTLTPHATVASSTTAVLGNLTVGGDLTVTGDDITMATNTAGHVLVGDGTNYNPVAISGDVTLASSGAITIASGSVETAMIAADAITSAKIADDAINSEHYTDGSIDTAHIANSQITVAKMAANSVDSDQYVDGSIDTAHIANLQITTGLIAADAITADKIADDVVNSEHYAAGSIDTEHIADSQVTVAKMADNSIDSDQYVDGSIDTAHISDNAVTLAKMAGIARGKFIIGDASGNPAVIGPGTNAQVLTSDGTDIAFAAVPGATALAADNLTIGDAAILLTTSSGNITIDAAANDSDIIFKGTNGGADTTYLTIDGSAAGAATFNDKIIATELDISGDIDVDGTTNLDVVDIDGAVDMASTLQVDGAITSSDGMIITTADNTAQLTLVSTDADANSAPLLVLDRNSASPADGDRIGEIVLRGRNDAGQSVDCIMFDSFITDASDGSEDSELDIRTMVGGSEATRILLDPAETVFNEASIDLDFRVEGNGNTHALFVNGETDRVAIGHNAPTVPLHVAGTGQQGIGIGSTNAGGAYLYLDGDSNGDISGSDYSFIGHTIDGRLDIHQNSPSGSNLVRIFTAGTERMRIDATGILTVGAAGSSVSAPNPAVIIKPSGVINIGNNSGVNDQSFIEFRRNGTQIGSVLQNGTTGVTYETSSDYRLKQNVVTNWDATTRLKQLKPSRFNFIADADTTVDGFLAHEVQEIVPEAISGTKDGTEDITDVVLNADGTVLAQGISETDWEEGKLSTTDKYGNTVDPIYASDTTWVASKTVPKYQGIDQSKLVPLLVKTIQELEARITALESA